MEQFDVSIDLTRHATPLGLPPVLAVERVKSAIQAMPGAGIIAVSWCSGKPPGQPWVEVHRPDAGPLVWDDDVGKLIAKLVRSEARRALFPHLSVAFENRSAD